MGGGVLGRGVRGVGRAIAGRKDRKTKLLLERWNLTEMGRSMLRPYMRGRDGSLADLCGNGAFREAVARGLFQGADTRAQRR